MNLHEKLSWTGAVIFLKRKSGLKTHEWVEEWIQLHNEELHNVYSSPNNIIMTL